MIVKPIDGIGQRRALCEQAVRVAAGLKTNTSRIRKWQTEKLGIPINQCGKRGDFTIDGRVMCRAHAGAAALANLIETQRVRTNEEEIARSRCQCDPSVVRRVIIEHGTCSMGGCPYGGDF